MEKDYVELAQNALEQETYRRHEIPELIKRLLESGQWKERDPNEELLESKTFNYFPDFIEAPRPWGLQAEWSFVNDLCKGYEDVELALAKEITGPIGVHTDVMDHHIIKKTTKQRQLIKLETERPDLLEKVKSGEISANAAMLEAGFRKQNIKATKEPKSVAEMIRKNFSEEEVAKIIKLLMS